MILLIMFYIAGCAYDVITQHTYPPVPTSWSPNWNAAYLDEIIATRTI